MKWKNAKRWNDGWLFCPGDCEGEAFAAPEHDDADWRALALPHDWDAEYAPEQSAKSGAGGGYAHAGVGWYRKHFRVTRAQLAEGKVTELIFEGVYMDSAVFCNGIRVGGHGYGYSTFPVDLTDALVAGDNVIAVRVDNSRQPNSRWYTGSGIYRDVYLRTTASVHLALFGVRADTNGIYPDEGQAVLQLRAEIENDGEHPADVEVQWALRDADGKVVMKAGAAVRVDDWDTAVAAARPVVAGSHLWTADDPYLYALTTTICVDGAVVDEAETAFGIRTAVFDKDRGFLLNGECVKIQGVCLHHDSGLFGAAFHKEVWRARLRLLKEMGANGIRCSHNPPAPALLDLCDEMGFLVMDEVFDEWMLGKNKNENYYSEQLSYGFGQFYDTDARGELTAMLRRDYNHPSVVLWSIGNEIPEQSSVDGARMARELAEICHAEDGTRMVTSACDNIAAPPSFCARDDFLAALDVVGYNYVGRWRGRADTFFEEDRHAHPDRRLIGSENPSVPGDRGDYATEKPYNANYISAPVRHELMWRYMASRDYVAGDFIWTGVDYLGEAHWPRRGAAFGPIDTAGFVKDAFYYFRSIWNREETTLHLLPHWNWQGEEGTFRQVIAYTSCERVRLYLNGRLVGEKSSSGTPKQGATKHWDDEFRRYHPTTNDLHLTWDVPYEPGTLRAEGFVGNRRVAVCEVTTTGKPVALSANKRRLGGFIAVEISAVDHEGRVVPDAAPMISVKCGKGARLVGMDAGDLSDLTAWASPKRRMCAGKLLAVLARAERTERSAPVVFSARGLKSAEIVL